MAILTLNRARRVRLFSARWQRRALFLAGGVVVGAVAVVLAMAADRTGHLFSQLFIHHKAIALGLTPVGFALCRFISIRFFPFSGGSGIPQAIAAHQTKDKVARTALVSLRMALGKIALVLGGLACGASIGREGPTVQLGAAIMHAAGRLSPRHQPGLILAGAAAGVAAAFNTPLAGIVFGIEEMSRSFEARTSGVIVSAVIAAGLTSLALQGDYTYFGITHASLHGVTAYAAALLVGAAGGLLGGVFSRVLIYMARGPGGWAGRVIGQYPVMFAAFCGALVAACGFASNGAAFGTGYGQARALLTGAAGTPALDFGLFKFVATLASSASFIPGGIFAPSLAVGAGLGADFAWLMPSIPSASLVVLGMVAYFAGVTQAPITAFVIVTEMTNGHAMVVPLMLAALVGNAVSGVVCKEGVYHALAEQFK